MECTYTVTELFSDLQYKLVKFYFSFSVIEPVNYSKNNYSYLECLWIRD
jgi:hypothetical protein